MVTRRVDTSPDIIPDDRNFGARIVGDVVLLPQKLLLLIVENSVDTDDLFYALIRIKTKEVAAALDWTVEQVYKAKNGFAALTGRNTIAPPPASSSATGLARPSFGTPPPKPASSKPPRYSFGPPPKHPLTVPPPRSSVSPKKKIG